MDCKLVHPIFIIVYSIIYSGTLYNQKQILLGIIYVVLPT